MAARSISCARSCLLYNTGPKYGRMRTPHNVNWVPDHETRCHNNQDEMARPCVGAIGRATPRPGASAPEGGPPAGLGSAATKHTHTPSQPACLPACLPDSQTQTQTQTQTHRAIPVTTAVSFAWPVCLARECICMLLISLGVRLFFSRTIGD